MKTLIPIVIGLLVVGCGNKQSTNTNEGNNTPVIPPKQKVGNKTPSNGEDNNSAPTKPDKAQTLEEKVVGNYETKDNEKVGFRENGIVDVYHNGEKIDEGSWKIVGKEVNFEKGNPMIGIQSVQMWALDASGPAEMLLLKIEPNGDLISVAEFLKGERKDFPKDDQTTWKKIK